MKSIPSPNFTKGRKRAPLVIVLHTTESPEVPQGAERVAQNWFALKSSKVSAHYIVSSSEAVRCVKEEDTAWHAGKANGWTIGIEMCGKAGQSASDWVDPFSKQMLIRTAQLVAEICVRHDIPVAKLGPGDLRVIAEGNDIRGICGHVDVSKGLGGTHYDPGPSFPWLEFLLMVKGYVDSPAPEKL